MSAYRANFELCTFSDGYTRLVTLVEGEEDAELCQADCFVAEFFAEFLDDVEFFHGLAS